MNAASASITVKKLAQLADTNYYVMRDMLRRYGLTWRWRYDRRGRLRVSYAALALVAPDLAHVVRLLLLETRRKRGRPRGFLGDKAKPGRKTK